MGTLMEILFKLRVICKKEFLVILKDQTSRIIFTAPIIVQAILFGYAATYNLDSVPYACIDNSRSKTSVEFLSKLDGTGIFKRVETLFNSNEISRIIDSNRAMLVITIDSDFEKKIENGELAPIQVITDGRNSMTSAVALGYVNSIVEEFNYEKSEKSRLIDIKTRVWYNPNLITRWSFLPGMIIALSLVQILMLSGLSVAREREQGTFDQLLVTPLSSTEILIGKAVPPIVIGIMQVTAVIFLCIFWFKIPISGSILTIYLTVLIFMISCVGIGLSISAISESMQQVMVYTFVIIMPMVLLSGLATPVRNMPKILRIITYANPMRFGVETIRRVYLEGATLYQVAYNFIPMIIVAILTLSIATWLFRNKLA